MKILKIILIIVLVLVGAWLVASYTGPENYKVERSAVINANDSITFEYVSKFQNWDAWSPWKEMDPSARYSIAGVDGTVGAVHTWEGEVTGKGSMTVTELSPNASMKYDLAFVEPWESKSTGGFTFENVGENQTKVSWYDQGDIPFSQRAMMHFMNLEEMMGPQFERGLAKIDSLARLAQNTMTLEANKEVVE